MEEIAEPIPEMGIIYFDYDKSQIKSEFEGIILTNLDWVINNPDIRIQLEGHCDERGTREYNLALGERRANAARNYLISLGIHPTRISTISYGKERPIVLGHNEAAWAQNRVGVSGVN